MPDNRARAAISSKVSRSVLLFREKFLSGGIRGKDRRDNKREAKADAASGLLDLGTFRSRAD